YAAGAGLSIGVPSTGIGVDIEGTWAEGLVAYSTTGNSSQVADAIINATLTDIELTRAWAVQAGLSADVTPTVSIGLDGTYAQVDHRGFANVISSGFGDFDTWVVAATVHWKPVSGLTISAEVAYENVDYEDELSSIGDYGPYPDDDVWGAMMRINRTF
ncbi:MAG TPA: porin, partial [Afifellaceae bacterium]|nr:porin [Afifellaceae bacterium]